MPLFKYNAKTQDGKVIKGSIELKNEEELNKYLQEQDLTLTSAEQSSKKDKSSISSFFSRFEGVSIKQKIFFIHNLEVMMRTGFSIGRALGVISEQTSSKKLKSIILETKSEVEKGVSFSQALEKHKKVFSELFISMIAAGEASGRLDEVLKKLAVQMRKDHTLISKVKSALTYPIIVVIAMIGVAGAVMFYVIPQLSSVFEESGTELPLITKILIGSSEFTVSNGIYIGIGLVILIFGFLRLKKTKTGKFYLHKILLRLPIFSPIIKKVNLARFSRSLSSLLKTDIPIVKTFEIIAKTLGNVHYQIAMKEASEKLKSGISVQKSLEIYPKLFTPVILQMIAVGEESGTLDSISAEIASFYEEEVDQTMNNLSTIIEPILMLLLGVGVAGMAAAIILPIYSLSETI